MDEKQSSFMKGLLAMSLATIVIISLLWVSSDAAAQSTGSCSIGNKTYCNQKSSGNCYCDRYCVRYGDCCEDYQSVCGGGTSNLPQLSVSANPNSVSADNITLSTVTAITPDKKSGVKISFLSDIGTLRNISCTTNSSGACSTTIGSLYEGGASIRAFATGYAQGTTKVTFSIGAKLGAQFLGIFLENISFDEKNNLIRVSLNNTGQLEPDARSIVIQIKATFGGKTLTYRQQLAIAGESVPFPKAYVWPKIIPVYDIGPLEGTVKLAVEIDPNSILNFIDKSRSSKEITIDLPVGFAKCTSLAKSAGQIEKKINIVFVPDIYTDKSKFITDSRSAANGILAMEPFLSNADKFNFWYVYPEGINLRKNDNTIDMELAKRLATSCPGYGETMVLSDDTGRDTGGNHFAHIFTKDRDAKLIGQRASHEFGHAFGGLSDEYVDRTIDAKTGLLISPMILNPAKQKLFVLTSPNCDESGCSKWCSGKINDSYTQLASKCSGAKTAQECAGLRESGCFWISTEPLVFDIGREYRCVVDPGAIQSDFGIDCKAGTGCFLGCGANGASLWRSSVDSAMNKGLNLGEGFNIISTQRLQSLLNNYA